VPGSIGATPIEAPVDIEEGLPVEVPLVYFYGHTTPSDHPELYKALVDRLGQLLDDRAKSSPQVHAEQSLLMAHMSLCVQSVICLLRMQTHVPHWYAYSCVCRCRSLSG